MRQFDVYRNESAGQAFAPFLVVLQSHHLDVLETVIVAPERRLLRKHEGEVLHLQDDIRRSIERLFTGF